MAEFESNVEYNTVLDCFEGPLDLLLHLIKEAKIEIKDIFVSSVTDQYLQYVASCKNLDIETAADYLNIAATIIEIKSKYLLPKQVDDEPDEQETNFFNLIEVYKLFQAESEKLKQQENVNRFYKEPDKSVGEVKIVYSDFNLDGLIKAFSKMLLKVDLKEKEKTALKEIPKDVFTVKDKVEFIRTSLTERNSMSFFELFGDFKTRNEVITTFQAMLELLKLQYITVEQKDMFDDITITLREDRNEELGEIDEYN